jgi:hypothetical protein
MLIIVSGFLYFVSLSMVIFLKERDEHKVCSFLNKRSNETNTLFYPSLNESGVVSSIDGKWKIFLPWSDEDQYIVNGLLCRSVLSVLSEIKN